MTGARFEVRGPRFGRGMVVLVAGVCLSAAACGGGSPTSPGPTPGPTTQTETLTGTVATYGIASHAFQASLAGTLTATLTWTAAADLDLYLTRSDCTGYPPDACVILARSTASTGAREEVTLTVASGDRLLVWVDNFSTALPAPYSATVTVR